MELLHQSCDAKEHCWVHICLSRSTGCRRAADRWYRAVLNHRLFPAIALWSVVELLSPALGHGSSCRRDACGLYVRVRKTRTWADPRCHDHRPDRDLIHVGSLRDRPLRQVPPSAGAQRLRMLATHTLGSASRVSLHNPASSWGLFGAPGWPLLTIISPGFLARKCAVTPSQWPVPASRATGSTFRGPSA